MSRPANPSLTLLHRARRALVAVPLVMAVALAATVVSGYSNVRHVLDTVIRSQGETFLHSARALARPDATWTVSDLQRLLDEHRTAGLRYIALYDTNLNLLASAGTPEGTERELRSSVENAAPRRFVEVGSRIRMAWRRRLPAELAEKGLRSPRPLLVEFEPLAADELRSGALRTLGIGGVASLALVLMSAFLWRLTLRAERIQEERERDRRLASLGELAAVISHEIRNPLTSMKGHAQLLAEHLEPGSRDRDKAERVVREAVRLEKLASDLLSLVRSERIERTDVDPARLLREAAESVDPEGIELVLEGAPPLWSVDAEKMLQVLTNLLRNAVQASPEPARPVAEVRVDEGRLVFTVRDFGDGIPEGEEARIFEPFYTTRVQGTGLGLAVARRVVALHGGTITAANHPQGGAVLRVAIPA